MLQIDFSCRYNNNNKYIYKAFGVIRNQSTKCCFSAFPEVHGDMVEVRNAAGRLFRVEGPHSEKLRIPMFVHALHKQ